MLEDEFPEVYRFVTSIYPSGEDDVITSPYNSILAMKELNEHADCVLPIDNQVRNSIVIYGRLVYTFSLVSCIYVYVKQSPLSAFPSKRKNKFKLIFVGVFLSSWKNCHLCLPFLNSFFPNIFLLKVFI